MAKSDNNDQVKFLVACISHSNNGRPDFDAVAKELDIVSKAAAQKRYERMLKANGVTKGGKTTTATDDDGAAPKPNPKKRKASAAGAGAKKSKAVKKEEDDDEDVKPAKKPARARGKAVKSEPKVEEDEESALSDAPKANSDNETDPGFLAD